MKKILYLGIITVFSALNANTFDNLMSKSIDKFNKPSPALTKPVEIPVPPKGSSNFEPRKNSILKDINYFKKLTQMKFVILMELEKCTEKSLNENDFNECKSKYDSQLKEFGIDYPGELPKETNNDNNDFSFDDSDLY